MNCRRHWNREILTERFPSSFINQDYKSHRENVLYERERSLLPNTQPAVAAAYKVIEMEEERRGVLDRMTEHRNQMTKLKTSLDELDIRIRTARFNKRNTRNNTYRSVVIRGCPKNDCRGFIQKNWECGICSVKICSKCHEILGAHEGAEGGDASNADASNAPGDASNTPGDASNPEATNEPANTEAPTGHVCLPENIETAKMIMSQTRPCPKCSVPIYKIDGCDQMFCTQCHTAFSWRSGEIVVKHIHNPHYYEWQRQNTDAPPREPGDIPCGGVPTIYEIRTWFQITDAMIRADRANNHRLRHPPIETLIPPIPKEYNRICALHRLAAHIEHVELPNHREPENQLEQNEDLRIAFLMNKMTEIQLKYELQKREKKKQKKKAIYLIYDMFLNTVADILRRTFSLPYSSKEVQRLLNQLNHLRLYFNEQSKVISRQFNSRVPNIHEKWEIFSVDYKS
jgi:hypothetical protein